MSESVMSIPIRQDLRPAYYDDFHCLADGCRLSCCKGWSITFNKKDYLSLRRQTGSPELVERLKGMRRLRHTDAQENQYGEFSMEGGVCALLREDCLCALQAERGPDALPAVCQTFPRTKTYMPSGYLERSLTPACEGVLALLWDLPEGLDFRSDPLPEGQERKMSITQESLEKGALFPFFRPIRELCIDLLQDRSFPLPRRILLMGMALKELAEGEADIPAWVVRNRSLPHNLADRLEGEKGSQALALFLSNNVHTLLLLHCGKKDDHDFVCLKEDLLSDLGFQGQSWYMKVSTAPYRAAQERFEKNFAGRDYFMENLMTSLFFHLNFPYVSSREDLWKSYVNFCNLYSFYRFMTVMSCRKSAAGDRVELFRTIVHASRSLIHNGAQQTALRDELFRNDSATLAHMAILLGD